MLYVVYILKSISKNLKETSLLAKKFLAGISKKHKTALLVLLSGNLGAGKTAFVKQVAKILGVKEKIISPTFVLMRKYTLPPPLPRGGARRAEGSFRYLIHIDAYRLENKKELVALNWDAISRDPNNIIFLEWPERVFIRSPYGAKKITFKFIDEKTREIRF